MKSRYFIALVLLGQLLSTGALVAQEEQPASPPSQATAEEGAAAEPSPDEAAIRANVEKYVESFNRRDSQTMATMWSPEAVYTNPDTGEAIVGQEAIAKQFIEELAGLEDAKLAVVIDSIEFVSPNVAIEKGQAIVTYSEHPADETLYTVVHVKRDGTWLIDRISETTVPDPPHTNYEQLKDLEWMVGSWIDEDETSSIQTDCEWTRNRNFMTRSFVASVRDQIDMTGMQVVGWDPVAKQIRSWVFDSDGGFGEGAWSREDDKWFIHAKGTLPDGRQYSAVNIITMIDDNSYTWQSTDRQVGGELLPNVEEVMIVRAPEE